MQQAMSKLTSTCKQQAHLKASGQPCIAKAARRKTSFDERCYGSMNHPSLSRQWPVGHSRGQKRRGRKTRHAAAEMTKAHHDTGRGQTQERRRRSCKHRYLTRTIIILHARQEVGGCWSIVTYSLIAAFAGSLPRKTGQSRKKPLHGGIGYLSERLDLATRIPCRDSLQNLQKLWCSRWDA